MPGPFLALITPVSPGRPAHPIAGPPEWGGDTGTPPVGGYPSLPAPPLGIWGGGNVPMPTPPIYITIPPGVIEGEPPRPAHPIWLPVFPAHPIVIPPGAIAPGVPTHPIVLPLSLKSTGLWVAPCCWCNRRGETARCGAMRWRGRRSSGLQASCR